MFTENDVHYNKTKELIKYGIRDTFYRQLLTDRLI